MTLHIKGETSTEGADRAKKIEAEGKQVAWIIIGCGVAASTFIISIGVAVYLGSLV